MIYLTFADAGIVPLLSQGVPLDDMLPREIVNEILLMAVAFAKTSKLTAKTWTALSYTSRSVTELSLCIFAIKYGQADSRFVDTEAVSHALLVFFFVGQDVL